MRDYLALIAAGSMLAVLSACSGGTAEDSAAGTTTEKQADPLARLEIKTAAAVAADHVPLGTVPGRVTLPPEARVAVTSAFPGAAIRVFVIEGQEVRRGQPLATIRAAETVQINGELARAQAEHGVAQARARRLGQLAQEGIIAQSRADEADAAFRQAASLVTEHRRLAGLAGASSDGTITLRAPISGRVAHVAVDTGGPVDTTTAPFVIEDAGTYHLDLQLPERIARDVRPGMTVEVSVPGSDGTNVAAAGRILSVAPSIDPATRSIGARASLGAVPGLVPGGNVLVTIHGNHAEQGVAIPAAAVTRIDGAEHVFVRQGAEFVARKVVLASQSGDQAVVIEGLKAGEVVATSSIAELKSMGAE